MLALAVAVVAAVTGLPLPTTASAFELPGCELTLTSIGPDGTVLDVATAGAPDATRSDPFVVAWDGTVRWEIGAAARSQAGTHGWRLDVFGFPTPLRGGQAAGADGSGTVSVGADAPFRVAGLFHVSGAISGTDGCQGGGWLRLAGTPFGTIPFFVGLALAVFGAVLAAAGARGRSLLAVAGGATCGAGLATLAIIFGILPLGPPTPPVLLLASLLVGVAAGWWGRRGGAAQRGIGP
jgi:hypothetical protein